MGKHASSTPSAAQVGAELDYDDRLPWLGHAYDWPTEVIVAWNKLVGPTHRYQGLTSFIPRHRHYAELASSVRLAFLGDVLPGRGRRYQVGDGVRQFLENADYLVLNLEGVLWDRSRIVNPVLHEPWILDFLADLFPPKSTILLCANNHAADAGQTAFERTCQTLRERGFRVLGRRVEPSLILPEGVHLSNGTEWLNVRRGYVARLHDADGAWSEAAKYRILCPHWGTEMMLYPTPRQIRRARRLLGQWNLIVGHHPHCPQPIVVENDRLVAYSLGNFARGDSNERGWHGAALLATVGPDNSGQWRLGEARWTFVLQKPVSPETLVIETADTCRFFAN